MEPFTGLAICVSFFMPLYTYTFWNIYLDS